MWYIMYLLVGLGWAVGTSFQQLKQSADKKKLAISAGLNLVCFPVAMLVTYFKEKGQFAKN